ncbi:hypothetical protein CRENPOLYSF2_1380003 [Crenothrix polyspora]|uniref:Uncharacterized protein n=1 Tax=Crenothrix polyspora TaxID=360316 RepID=A0A1R4H0T3_9GAMM|nr:hypothetical protein CRENPOLYSF2_1380003 [Crenothrix polyspora]
MRQLTQMQADMGSFKISKLPVRQLTVSRYASVV